MAGFDFEQTLPALDQNLCNVWAELDPNQYQKYAFYLVKAELEMRKRFQIWTNILSNTIPWTPNMATIMRTVLVEKSPILRQSARPNYVTVDPMTDIFNVRERTAETRLQWQDFESPHFSFLPSFQDFMQGNLVPTRQNIEEQVRIYEDLFYRTAIWDNSPNLYVCGNTGIVQAPTGVTASGNTLSSAKTPAWLYTNTMGQTGGVGYLTYQELFNAAQVFAQEVGATPHMGDGGPNGENQILDQKYLLVCSNEAWMQFTNDPWIKENRPLSMNIINNAFKGPLFDTIVARIEDKPLRFAVAADPALSDTPITEPAPDTVETNPNAQDYGRTKPNPAYTKLDQAEYEVAWLIGGKHYRRVQTGPPPEVFAGSVDDPSKIAGMNWNGKIYATRNFLIPCKDSAGNVQQKLNDRGRYVRFQGSLALGILAQHPFNIMPIIFRRRRGTTTTAVAGA